MTSETSMRTFRSAIIAIASAVLTYGIATSSHEGLPRTHPIMAGLMALGVAAVMVALIEVNNRA